MNNYTYNNIVYEVYFDSMPHNYNSDIISYDLDNFIIDGMYEVIHVGSIISMVFVNPYHKIYIHSNFTVIENNFNIISEQTMKLECHDETNPIYLNYKIKQRDNKFNNLFSYTIGY